MPFHCGGAAPWGARWPRLGAHLLALADAEVERLHADPQALAEALAPVVPGLAETVAAARLPRLAASRLAQPAAHALTDVPGRKARQVQAFVAALRPLQDTRPAGSRQLLDWCAGKAHLGRRLGRLLAAPLIVVERDPVLAAAALHLAARDGVPAEARVLDVLRAPAGLAGGQHVLALHACGELHRQLLRAGPAAGVDRISLSPCCYPLGAADGATSLSGLGAAAALQPTRDDLRLAVQETVNATARVQRRRGTESRWRLGFDALQRALRGSDTYLPVPPLPHAVWRGSFAAFCRLAAAHKGLALPTTVDWAHWQAEGQRRHARVRRWELARHALRRAVEVHVVLDQALYLEQLGYRVRLGTFCPRDLTPRNILLDARA